MNKQINDMDLLSQRNDCTLVFNEKSLKHALSKDLQMDFLKLSMRCKAVICCRTTSKHKAEASIIVNIKQLLDVMCYYVNTSVR